MVVIERKCGVDIGQRGVRIEVDDLVRRVAAVLVGLCDIEDPNARPLDGRGPVRVLGIPDDLGHRRAMFRVF